MRSNREAFVVVYDDAGLHPLTQRPQMRVSPIRRDGTHLVPSFITTQTLKSIQKQYPLAILREEEDEKIVWHKCSPCQESVPSSSFNGDEQLCSECMEKD